MTSVVYVTGNPDKAANFSRHIGMPIQHHPADLDEIQTLDAVELVEHKAKQAYSQLNRPVLVEDVMLSFNALGGLPGPFIKFFVTAGTDINCGVERLCRMLDGFTDRSASASCTFGYFDGLTLRVFTGETKGVIADSPRGENGFGFDKIFIPNGFNNLTAAQLPPADYEKYYTSVKPFLAVRNFLNEQIT